MRFSVFALAPTVLAVVLLAGCDQSPSGKQEPAIKDKAKELPWGKVTRHGMFHERGRGWVRDTEGGTGKVIKGATLTMEEQDTRRIPLRRGVFFGYKYWLKFPPDQKRPSFTRILSHPEMILPDGSKVTRSERAVTKKATHGIVTSIDAYALSEDYELVEGDWTFQLWSGDKMMAEQTFTTYWPADKEASSDETMEQPAVTTSTDSDS